MESQFAYIVVDTEDMSVPLAICSSREKAVEMAEKGDNGRLGLTLCFDSQLAPFQVTGSHPTT